MFNCAAQTYIFDPGFDPFIGAGVRLGEGGGLNIHECVVCDAGILILFC